VQGLRRKLITVVAVSVVVAGGVLGGAVVGAGQVAPSGEGGVSVREEGRGGTGSPEELSRAFRRATERALPSVVFVEVEAVRRARIEVPEPFRGTPWEDLFRRGEPQSAPRVGNGSGVIFRPDGYILTNNHVVDGANRVRVVMQDRREFEARVIGRDPNTDIAVLKVDATGLPAATLGDSDAVEVGDWVIALGYPLHLGSTATAGIVSAKGRSLGIIGRNEEASAPLEAFIQTDAAINPGNSGGALVDLEGRLIGINTAIASPTGYYSGYGFAVPIHLARRVAEDLIERGAVQRPRLGVQIDEVDPADAEVYRLERATGVEVKGVEPGGSAERAGIRLGDVIVGVDGRTVESTGALMELLARYRPGQRVTLDVVRYGERLRVPVELGAFESQRRADGSETSQAADGLGRLGFRAADPTSAAAKRLGVQAERGAVVVDVEAGGPAARAGVQPGLVVERFNGREVGSAAELERLAREVRPGQAVSLVVTLPDGRSTIVNYRVRG